MPAVPGYWLVKSEVPGYWLVKSEVDDYSIDDLKRDGVIAWTGVRNYEARNTMRDDMAPGDLVLYYHSNAKPSGIVGLAKVKGAPYPDPTQFDPDSRYFDRKATAENPRWWLVDLEFVEKFPQILPLADLKRHPDLQDMVLVRRMRLSVQPVTPAEFDVIRRMAS